MDPDRSCYDLHREYIATGRTPDECARNFVDWQTAEAGGAGFVLGLPGLAFGIVTIPADLTYTTYLQMRMIAVIALLHGWDPKSDRLKTVAMLCLLGAGAGDVVQEFGVNVGMKVGANALAKLPGRVLIQINQAVGFRLLTKAGTTGTVNLVKFVPVLGGLVSGGLNAYLTRQIALHANDFLKGGPHAGPVENEEVERPGGPGISQVGAAGDAEGNRPPRMPDRPLRRFLTRRTDPDPCHQERK